MLWTVFHTPISETFAPSGLQLKSTVHAWTCQSNVTVETVSVYHLIESIAEEERLLEKMLQLQSQIRAKSEHNIREQSSRSNKYTKIFEPVTKGILKLTALPQPLLLELI